MQPKGNCNCGKKAEVVIIHETGMGLSEVNICKECETKAKDLVQEIMDLTGLGPYSFNPSIRPDGWKE